jgi:Protein of unknown function (DUF3237)
VLGEKMNVLNALDQILYTYAISALLLPSISVAQTTTVSTEYLMTLYAPLEIGQEIDSSLDVNNVRPGRWVKGPRIKGTLLAPAGDWSRALPSGAWRLDVRATIRTDDGALIYLSYNGIFKSSAESEARATKGAVLTSKDMYLVIAPTMQTSAKKYDWLNGVQCIGKMVSYQNDSYVKYDIFVVR